MSISLLFVEWGENIFFIFALRRMMSVESIYGLWEFGIVSKVDGE